MLLIEAIAKYYNLIGIKYIFGGAKHLITPDRKELLDSYGISYQGLSNETSAVYAAIKYAKLSRKIGVCFLSSEMSIYNGLSGIADAYRSRIPLLTFSYSQNHQIDHHLTLHITKYTGMLSPDSNIMDHIAHAYNIATTPPYGPVHLTIPEGLLTSEVADGNTLPRINDFHYDHGAAQKAVSLLNDAEDGLIFVGEGCRSSVREIKQLAQILNWPLVTTGSAKDLLGDNFPYYIGYYDRNQPEYIAPILHRLQYDTVLFLGTSLGTEYDERFDTWFVRNRNTLHIDYVANELVKIYNTTLNIYYDLDLLWQPLIRDLKAKATEDRNCIEQMKSCILPQDNTAHMIHHFSSILPSNSIIFVDSILLGDAVMKHFIIKEQTIVDYGVLYNCTCDATGAKGGFLAKPDFNKVCIWDHESLIKNAYDVYLSKNEGILFIIFNTDYENVSIANLADSFKIRHNTAHNSADLMALTDELKSVLFKNEPYILEIIVNVLSS